MPSPTPSAAYTYLDTTLALSQIGDLEAMNGMLSMLQETLTHDLPLIDDFLRAGEIAKANRLLHPLKGFLPIFCPPTLCAHVVAVEGLSKDVHSTSVASAYVDLKPRLEQLLAEVSAYLQTLAP